MALLIAVLALPALASAKAAPVSLEIGPLPAAHGYKLDLVVPSCAGTTKDTVVDYVKSSHAGGIAEAAYDYSGTGTCTAATNLQRGTLAISWPGLATAKLKVATAGPDRAGRTPVGCRGGKGITREVELTGSIDIHASKYFGTFRSRRVKAYLSRLSDLNCKSAALPKSTNLTASFGQVFLVGARFKKVSEVIIDDSFKPAAGVTGTFFLDVLGTGKQFAVSPTAATITDVKPFASGTLVATKQPVCIGDTAKAVNVVLSGSITIDSPVLGVLSLSSSTAKFAYLGASDAKLPAQCDGVGSTPLTPSVDNTCSSDGACSVMDATNNDTFNDVSQPGTQTIVSETIDFGDGSTGTFTNGSVQHSYAAAGTYTATITIETSNGQTQTTTTPVDIDS